MRVSKMSDDDDNIIHVNFGEKKVEKPETTDAEEVSLRIIGSLYFHDLNGNQWHLDPRPDITAYESTLIYKMFYIASTEKDNYIHFLEYVNKHNLNRHFTVV